MPTNNRVSIQIKTAATMFDAINARLVSASVPLRAARRVNLGVARGGSVLHHLAEGERRGSLDVLIGPRHRHHSNAKLAIADLVAGLRVKLLSADAD